MLIDIDGPDLEDYPTGELVTYKTLEECLTDRSRIFGTLLKK